MRNFKKIASLSLFIIVILVVNQILLSALKPYNSFRSDIHSMKTNQYDDIFVGASHGKAAIHPEEVDAVTGRKSLNMCLGGEFPMDSYYIIKEASKKNKPKRIIYEVDPSYWVTEAQLGPDFLLVYDEFPWSSVKLEYFKNKMMELDFRPTLFPWYMYRQGYGTAIDRLKNRTSQAYRSYEYSFYDNEYQTYRPDGGIDIKRSDVPKSEEAPDKWKKSNLNKESIEYFDKIVNLCRQQNIELIAITTPIPKEMLEKYESHFSKAYSYFQAYFNEKKVPYYNFNDIHIEGFDTTINGFFDFEGHMYGDQAKVFSKQLGQYLKGREEQL